MLDAFVSKRVEKLPLFGIQVSKDLDNCRYFEWPEKIPKNMLLHRIKIQQEGGDSLRGIAFELSNGSQTIESPIFSGANGLSMRTLSDHNNVPINLSLHRISRVGFKVFAVGKMQIYHGIRLATSEKTIIDETWYSNGKWEY